MQELKEKKMGNNITLDYICWYNCYDQDTFQLVMTD